jgi:hypothetical protein
MFGTKQWLVLAAVVVVSVFAGAQDKGIKSSNAWVQLPASGATEAMAFVTVENAGMYEVNITSATADASGKVDLREGGQAVAFISVPAYGRVDMSATGVHLMLIGLKRTLKAGDTVMLTLATDMDVTLNVAASVRAQ